MFGLGAMEILIILVIAFMLFGPKELPEMGKQLGKAIKGKHAIDLFAGTGALALEALPRGADFAVMIETGTEGRGLIRENVEALDLTGVTKIFRRDAAKLGAAGTVAPFDLIFCDPPYGKGLGEKALTSALAGGWIAPGGLAVLEERAEMEVTLPDGFTILDRRQAGDTQLVFTKFG